METVLVVEDNDEIRELVVQELRAEGYKVCEAENGQVALDVLARLEHEPCLVLLDWMMPVMDGRKFLNALGGVHRLASLPVVVVSAAVVDHPSGARRVIEKPLSIDLLLGTVKEFCGNGDSQPASPPHPPVS